MQQSINNSTQQKSKFDFFHKNKEYKATNYKENIIGVSSGIIVLTLLLFISSFSNVSDYLKKSQIQEHNLQINSDKELSFLSNAFKNKKLGNSQLTLSSLSEFNSIEIHNKTMDLLLSNPIYEKNSKKYSPEFKILISHYLLSVKSNANLEELNIKQDIFIKTNYFFIFQEKLLDKKLNNSSLKYKQYTTNFKNSYLKLTNEIDDSNLKLVLQNHFNNLSTNFDKNLKNFAPSN